MTNNNSNNDKKVTVQQHNHESEPQVITIPKRLDSENQASAVAEILGLLK